MTSLQETIIKTLHVQPKIDPATEIERRVDFLASFLKKTGMKTFWRSRFIISWSFITIGSGKASPRN